MKPNKINLQNIPTRIKVAALLNILFMIITVIYNVYLYHHNHTLKSMPERKLPLQNNYAWLTANNGTSIHYFVFGLLILVILTSFSFYFVMKTIKTVDVDRKHFSFLLAIISSIMTLILTIIMIVQLASPILAALLVILALTGAIILGSKASQNKI